MRKSLKIVIWACLIVVLVAGGFFAGSTYYSSKQNDTQSASTKTESSNKSSAQNTSKRESSKYSQSDADSTSSSSAVSESTSTESTSSVETPKIDPITLDEGIALIQKVDGEVPSDSIEIISSNGSAITIGGGIGAKGYDKITLKPDADGNVSIHEEFGTLDGGSYSVLDYMPAEDYTTTR